MITITIPEWLVWAIGAAVALIIMEKAIDAHTSWRAQKIVLGGLSATFKKGRKQ